MKAHFVTFFSPGTFVAEETTKPIHSWDKEEAIRMAGNINERHGAIPYGFQFTTRERSDTELDSKVVATGPMYFINCRVLTLVQLETRNKPEEAILRSNMRGNGWEKVAQTIKGWRWTQPIREGDIVL